MTILDNIDWLGATIMFVFFLVLVVILHATKKIDKALNKYLDEK